MPAPEPLPLDLECHRAELTRWAVCHVPAWLRAHLDPTDLVQQTMLEAWDGRDRLIGQSAQAVRRYLFRALANNLIDTFRHHRHEQGDVSPGAMADSSLRMADWVIADDTSPSLRAERNERFARLAGALARLPEAQRLAVELRYLLGCRRADIARTLDRSEDAVSQLLFRALAALRTTLTENERGEEQP